MFKTVRMQKLKIVTPDKYAPNVVKNLHEAGIIQVEDVSERIQQDSELAELLRPSKVSPYTGKISSLLMKVTGISDLFGDALTENLGLKSKLGNLISPEIPVKKEVPDMDTEQLIEHAESILSKVEPETNEVENKIATLDGEKSSLESNIAIAERLNKIDFDLSLLQDSKHTSSFIGRMNVESVEKYKNELSQVTDKFLLEEIPEDNGDFKIVLTIVANDFKDEVYILLRKFDFERLDVTGLEGTPSDIISKSQARISQIEEEKSQTRADLKRIAERWDDDVIVLKEQLEIEKERNEIYASFGKTKTTKMLEAYIPKPDVNKALNILDESTDGNYVSDLEDVDESSEDIPVLQKNNAYAKPYERLVQMYGSVKYNCVDPTLFVAITFPFFFGFCLTDAAYGVVVSILGYVLYRGMGKVRDSMKDFGLIVMVSGIWAIILGLLTNGLFGDFTGRFFKYNLPTVIPMVDAFKNPANILIIAIAIGVLYTNIGFILGAINNIRNNDLKEALGSQICWFILEAGVVFLAAGFMIPAVGLIGKIIGGALIVVTLILLVYSQGAYGVMDIFGFLGDILSYARLLALCLATGGIAMTVNILAELLNNAVPFAGIILAIVIFIFGHIANFAFQVLGAFVNALRLNYVEFFGQFFISGKNMFKPFKAERKFTKLDKD